MCFSNINRISSAQNPKFKYWEKLTTSHGAAKADRIVIEGMRQIETAGVGQNIEVLIFADNKAGENAYDDWFISGRNDPSGDIIKYRLSEHLFRRLSAASHSQGILAIMPIPHLLTCTPELMRQGRPVVYLDKLSDPGNLGTIIRTADALGFAGIILSDSCVNPFNPKVTRSAMGSLFHIRLFGVKDFPTFVDLTGADLTIAADLGGILLPDFQPVLDDLSDKERQRYKRTPVLIIGNEAHGIDPDIVRMAKYRVRIPMFGGAESLNAAIAFGIMGYALVCPINRV